MDGAVGDGGIGRNSDAVEGCRVEVEARGLADQAGVRLTEQSAVGSVGGGAGGAAQEIAAGGVAVETRPVGPASKAPERALAGESLNQDEDREDEF